VRQDCAKAAKWFSEAAEQGNAFAQNKLGLMYFKGEGVPQDYVVAADKLRNNMNAAEYQQVVLGLIFLKYISNPSQIIKLR
jgi:TPR repeat protein